MDPHEFENRLFTWLDGELPPEQARKMEAHCAADAAARARAEAEREFERRVRAAMLGGARDAREARELVAAAFDNIHAAARADTAALTAPRTGLPHTTAVPYVPAGRLVRLHRWFSGMAAAAAVLVGVMWFHCIPPFECGVIEALEKAADAPPAEGISAAGLDREPVPIALGTGGKAWRSHLTLSGGDATLVVWDETSEVPSFRREVWKDGEMWWVAERGDRTLVCFRDPADRRLWCVTGALSEPVLFEAARRLRHERAASVK